MSQRILIIGGHGHVALLAAPLLVERGHSVFGVIRNPEHSDDVTETGATPVVADVETASTEHLVELFKEADVVIWSAGAGGGDPERTYAVDRDAAIRSMQAAGEAGVRRYVMVSYFGAGPDHGVPETDSFFPYADAKTAADEYLRGTDLDWTILGPSRLTFDNPTGSIEVDRDGSVTAGEVPRADVAAVIAETVERDDTVGRTILFNGGEQPIAVALGH